MRSGFDKLNYVLRLMRLLNTCTGQFVWIADPSAVRYAILSHTWRSEEEGGEQSYDDFRELQASTRHTSTRLLHRIRGTSSRRSPQSSVLSHSALSDKVKGFCKIAHEAGYELVWIDSCCIDSSSSAELSEAINSMYQWYRLAEVCYVYLADVPDGDKPAARDSAFRTSRWRTRGWTLQELIAPKRVVFLTRTWRFLGTKMGFASTLEEITGIDFAILTGIAELESVSVARRMSWAAGRKTKRIEDEAYCLMGLFGVHMATIYGEGRNAFLRLQEEIIKTIPDQSIFAWGRSCTVMYDIPRNKPFVPPPAKPMYHLETSRHGLGLLALSPQDFESARDVAPLPLEEFASLLGGSPEDFKLPSLHCLFTPQGVALHLLILDLSAELTQIPEILFEYHTGPVRSVHCTRQGEFQSLALLRCQDEYGSLVALPLSRLPEVVPARVQEPLVVATHAACHLPEHLHIRPRSIRLGKSTLATARAQLPAPRKVREVYIRRHLSSSLYHNDPSSTLGPHRSFGNTVTVNIARESVEELASLGFKASPLSCWYTDTHLDQTLTANATFHSGGDTSGDSGQDIKVGVILTNTAAMEMAPPVWSTSAHFSVDHFFRTPFLGRRSPVPHSPARPATSMSSHCDYAVAEAPCADDSGGRRTSTVRRTESGALHAQAEFVLHADADWESDAADTRLLRVAVRGTPGARAAGYAFELTVELSERSRPKRSVGALPARAPQARQALAVAVDGAAHDEVGSVATSRTAVDMSSIWVNAAGVPFELASPISPEFGKPLDGSGGPVAGTPLPKSSKVHERENRAISGDSLIDIGIAS